MGRPSASAERPLSRKKLLEQVMHGPNRDDSVCYTLWCAALGHEHTLHPHVLRFRNPAVDL
jgi:hypothetical protein